MTDVSEWGRMTRRGFTAGAATLAAWPARAVEGGHIHLAEAARGLAPDGLVILAPEGSQANLDVIAAMFAKMSGIDVTVETTGIQGVGNDLMLRHMSGGPQFDLALPATTELPDLISAGAIMPLSDAPLRAPDSRSFYPHGDIFDGRRYGYFTDGDQQMLFFNRTLLERDDIARAWEDATGRAMAIPNSWGELDAQMRHVARTGEGLSGGLFNRNPGFVEIEFWLRCLAAGIWPLDEEFTPQLATDEGVQVLLDMIAVDEAVAPVATGPGSLAANSRLFEEGRILAFMSYGGLQKILNRRGGPLADRLAFSAPPGGGDAGLPPSVPAMTWGWSYTIPTRAPHPEAAGLFAAFAVSAVPSTEAIRVASGFFDPFLEAHYLDAGIGDVYGEPFLKAHRAAMSQSIPDFYVARRGDYMAALGRWLGLALGGGVMPETALKSAENDWRLITATLDRDAQIARWRALRAAFPTAIASKLRDIDASGAMKEG